MSYSVSVKTRHKLVLVRGIGRMPYTVKTIQVNSSENNYNYNYRRHRCVNLISMQAHNDYSLVACD